MNKNKIQFTNFLIKMNKKIKQNYMSSIYVNVCIVATMYFWR